jgi:hypothetical protein
MLLATACSSAASAPAPSAPATPIAGARAPVTFARALAPAPLVGDPRATGDIVRARIVISIDGAAASDRPAYARADQRVELYAVVEIARGGSRAIYSDAPSPSLDGRAVRAEPLARAPELAIAWSRVEPAAASYSNEDGGSFHFEPIEYRATPIDDAANRASITADVRPTLTPDHGAGIGTMRYQIAVARGGKLISSPGADARRGRGSGGLVDAVARVSIRRDDTYLGYLTELYGQPYVWASAGLSDATHQSERLEGADCADFVVYGARRAGKQFAYTWTGGLPQITRLLAAGTRDADGIYRDRRGQPLPFTRAGDLVLFPRHVGVLVEDRGTIGVLDDADVIVHALFDTPKQVPIADSGYADKPVELRRFR